MNIGDPEDRSAEAGEYVLGTLDATEARAFDSAMQDSAALQAEVYAWQDRLLGLAARVPAADPGSQLWPRIEARLAAPLAAPGTGAAASPVPAANDPLWQRLRRWQFTSALAIAASLVLATVLGLLLLKPAQGTRYLALLQAPDRSTGWVVEGAPGATLRLVPVADRAVVPPGKTLQFWTKPEGATGPTSLGLVRSGQPVELPYDRLPGLAERQLFELTLEPDGGSPLGKPTGPVLYIGRALRI